MIEPTIFTLDDVLAFLDRYGQELLEKATAKLEAEDTILNRWEFVGASSTFHEIDIGIRRGILGLPFSSPEKQQLYKKWGLVE